MKTKTIENRYSVRIYGSEMGHAGWIEGKVLDVMEYFPNQREARAWARKAMKRLSISGKSACSHYKVEPVN